MKKARELCKQATPGPWYVGPGDDDGGHTVDTQYAGTNTITAAVCPSTDHHEGLAPLRLEDAEFIAYFNPERVAQLLDIAEAAKEMCFYSGNPNGKYFGDAVDRLEESLKELYNDDK